MLAYTSDLLEKIFGNSTMSKNIFLVLIVLIISGDCKAKVYRVGGGSGWTNIGNLTYKSWAASNTFHVGDTLLFSYNKVFQNVVRVSHKNFNACNSTAPYAIWATGNDSFTISKPGHFYFICSFPGHCESGQKVDIRVLKEPKPECPPSPVRSSPTSESPSRSGPSKESVPPAPSPKSTGVSSFHFSWKLWIVLVAIALPAIAA